VLDTDALRRALLDVMQTTFVTLQSAGDSILENGHKTFITLCTRHFEEMVQVLLSRIQISS
jgi:hypothetical protein